MKVGAMTVPLLQPILHFEKNNDVRNALELGNAQFL